MQSRPGLPRVEADERRLLSVGLLALVAFLALGAVVAAGPPSGLDVSISTWVITTFASGPVRAALDVLNVLGSLEGGAVLTMVLAIVLLATRARGAAMAILSTWLAELAGAGVKLAVGRARPPGAVVAGVLGESWAYPSGHVIRAMALVAVLVWLSQDRGSDRGIDRGSDRASAPAARADIDPRRAWLALAAGLAAGSLMGIARLAVGAHWPTDVIGGLFLGTAFVCFFAVLADRFERRGSMNLSGSSAPPPGP